MKNTKTKAQIAYERERRNLQRRIRTIEKQGLESNLEIKELASRKYTSNVAANRAALNKMRRLTNEMLKRSSNVSSFRMKKSDESDVIVLTPAQYEIHLQRLSQEKKERAKERRSLESRMKKNRFEDIKATEQRRATKYKREPNFEKAMSIGRYKDEIFIENFESGWQKSYENLVLQGAEEDDVIERFRQAMRWTQSRGFYTELSIIKWAQINATDMVSQVFESKTVKLETINVSVLEKFINFLKDNYGYTETKQDSKKKIGNARIKVKAKTEQLLDVFI